MVQLLDSVAGVSLFFKHSEHPRISYIQEVCQRTGYKNFHANVYPQSCSENGYSSTKYKEMYNPEKFLRENFLEQIFTEPSQVSPAQ